MTSLTALLLSGAPQPRRSPFPLSISSASLHFTSPRPPPLPVIVPTYAFINIMSFPMSQSSGSDAARKVPIPRDQSRRYRPPARRTREVKEDRILRACTSCRARKVRCDGGQPNCRNCGNNERPCVYLESRKDRLKMFVAAVLKPSVRF